MLAGRELITRLTGGQGSEGHWYRMNLLVTTLGPVHGPFFVPSDASSVLAKPDNRCRSSAQHVTALETIVCHGSRHSEKG